MDNTGITLKRAMRILDGEAYTIGTLDGEGWLYYFDGKELHDGSRYDLFNELLNRECVEVYEREERKRFLKEHNFMELKGGLAFIVTGKDSGTI